MNLYNVPWWTFVTHSYLPRYRYPGPMEQPTASKHYSVPQNTTQAILECKYGGHRHRGGVELTRATELGT
jgi:hypothetical protein